MRVTDDDLFSHGAYITEIEAKRQRKLAYYRERKNSAPERVKAQRSTRVATGKCRDCALPAVNKNYCAKHREECRARNAAWKAKRKPERQS